MKQLLKHSPDEAISLRRTLVRFISGPLLVMQCALLVSVMISAFFLVGSILLEQDAVLDGLSGQINQYLDETGQLVETLSDSTQFLDDEQMLTLFDQLRESYPRFSAFYILDSDGIVVVESAEEPVLLGLDLSGEEFFQARFGSETTFSEPFVSLLNNQVVVTTAAPIQLKNTRNQGVLVAELNLALLQEKIEELAGSDVGETFVLDAKGVYIAHPDISIVERREYFSSDPIYEGSHDDGHRYQIMRELETDVWQAASVADLEIGWTIISKQPLTIVLRPVYYELGIVLLALVVVALGFWLNVQRSFRQISAPLASLAEKAEEISSGKYEDFNITKPRQYREIASLENSFSKMISAIQERDRTLERRVEDRTKQLEEANRDLESFMYSVSHDLRAPLRAINGFAKFLSEEYLDALDEQGRFYLDRILSNSLRMDQLIDDLLDLSRLGRQSLEIEQIEVNQIVKDVVAKIREQHDPCEVTFELKDCPPISADRQLLEIMLTNLIGNAVKFTRQQPEPRVEFGSLNQNGATVYYVKDNGVGFNMDYADKLYQPFQRLHSQSDFEGTGIGLAIVGRVVRSHEGEIWVDSQEGKGTTFYFNFDNMNK
jgi:signal transduction histidine kinase